MESRAHLARLNVLIELLSECARAHDLDSLIGIALGRLHWVIDYDRCTVTVARGEARSCWLSTRATEHPARVAFDRLPPNDANLLEQASRSGAPAVQAPGAMCVPIEVAGAVTGAICFVSQTVKYTQRDLRLGHHAAQYLGSLVARIELEEETKRLSQRKDEILALLGHELRNPLAPIVTAVHLLRAQAEGRPSKMLDVIDRQAQHLVRLLDDLLDVARLTRDKIVLERTTVEVSRVVALATEMVLPLLEQRRHHLAVDVPAAGLPVDADVHRLAQVVSNLLNNAARYTAEGGHLTVTARREDETVVLAVSDDGPGIPSGARSEIFDSFVQGANRTGGLGLGLAIVKSLTELHGGSVSVESSERGSTFSIRLPLATAPVSTVPPPSEGSSETTARKRVLVVDDNDDARDLLSTFLAGEGHEVTEARDGPEALGLLDRARPAVALLDIGMPGMDGYELAARIRARQDVDQPYLVALTGFGQPMDRERSRSAGFDEHLTKPVDLAQLLHVIARP